MLCDGRITVTDSDDLAVFDFPSTTVDYNDGALVNK